MPRHPFALLALAALAACGDDVTASPPMADRLASSSMLAPAPPPRSAGPAEKTLAYSHFVQINVADSRVAPLFDSIQAVCLADTLNHCAVLEASISKGDMASASLRFRTAHDGVTALIAALSRAGGDIVNRSTTAEDLAAPIADAGRELAMLTDYRDRLEALRARASSDVDALIKLNHELADVQQRLEAAAGESAHLRQRVDTEILSLSIASTHDQSAWSPVIRAIGQFGQNLFRGAASAITGLAFLLPWTLLLVAIAWAVRAIRRRRAASPSRG